MSNTDEVKQPGPYTETGLTAAGLAAFQATGRMPTTAGNKPMSAESIQDFCLMVGSFQTSRIPYPCSAREGAHLDGKCHSKLNGTQPIFALLGYDDVRTLEGRLLTLVDASFPDREQRKAFKDLIRRTIWWDWVNQLDTDNAHCGIPDRV